MRVDVVFLLLSPGTANHAECLEDPVGFIDRRGDVLAAHARRRLHEADLLPVARGSAWGVVLPGETPDVASVAGLYGDELAEKLAQACGDFPDNVVLWHVVEVVPKGRDGATQPVTWKGLRR